MSVSRADVRRAPVHDLSRSRAVDTLIDLAVAQARRGRRSAIYLASELGRDRCRQRLRRHHPELKKLIRMTNLAGNDLILEQVHEAIRVRREVTALKEIATTESTRVD